MAFFSQNGQFGAGYDNPQYGNWGGSPAMPWPDPTQAIQGAQRGIRREMNQNFNRAGAWLGETGTQGGTPWANKIGGAANQATQAMADVANQYTYQAADANANRGLSWNQQQSSQAFQGGQNAANRKLSWNSQQSAQNAGAQENAWQRYYDSMLKGGSPDYMQNWQQQMTPWAQQYGNQQSTPWAF